MSAARRALRNVLASNRFTAAELADCAECSISAIHSASSCNDDRSDLSAAKYELISRYLSSHGDQRVASAFVSPDHMILRRTPERANGQVEDELRDLVDLLGQKISPAHREKNRAAMEEAITVYRAIGDRLDAEAALLD